jgi:eukaryotic-like serine/threonine-protein kinase
VSEDAAEPVDAGPLGPVITALLCKDPAVRPGAEEVEQMLAGAAEGRRPGMAQAYAPTQRRSEPSGAYGTPDAPGAYGTPDAPGAYGTPGAGAQEPGHATISATAASGTPAMPVAPTATAHQPAPAAPAVPVAPPPAPARRGRGRTVALVVLLAALVGGGGAAALHYADEWRAGNSSATDGSDGSDGSDGADRSDGVDGADGADRSEGTGQGDQSASDAVPEGWERVEDPEGFSLALPKGWKRQLDGVQIDYTPDGGEHFLRVAVDDSPDFDSPYHHQIDLEEQVQGRLSEYRQVSLEENIYRDRPGALWDFTWTALEKDTEFPGPRRAIEQTYLSRDGVEYTIYMSSPVADWDTAEKQFYSVLRSWRPAQQ